MSEGIKSGIALELEEKIKLAERLVKEFDDRMIKRLIEDTIIFGSGFITWDDEVTKKIDLNDLLKDKPKPEKDYKCYPHHWVEYTGLVEKFFYCKYCNQKSDPK